MRAKLLVVLFAVLLLLPIAFAAQNTTSAVEKLEKLDQSMRDISKMILAGIALAGALVFFAFAGIIYKLQLHKRENRRMWLVLLALCAILGVAFLVACAIVAFVIENTAGAMKDLALGS
ncbi:MAG: hypothetical protein ABIH99_01995 [Candidatus Micrarchaeota archaeon]